MEWITMKNVKNLDIHAIQKRIVNGINPIMVISDDFLLQELETDWSSESHACMMSPLPT